MAPVTGYTSIGRDTLLRVIAEPEFFTQNPALEPWAAELRECVRQFRESKASSSCGCGGNRELLTDCFTHMLDALEGFAETNPQAVADFVVYITKRPQNPDQRTAVTMHHKRTGDNDLHKYEFIA